MPKRLARLQAYIKLSEFSLAKNEPIGKNCRRGRPRDTESALNRQNDDNDYTESSGTSTSSNAEKSPDTNQMLNEKNNENENDKLKI
jgi:hypothetical protein